jgi:hypothetical protein
VPLDETAPSRDRVGPLRYLGGLWLRSSDPRFGGLSDVRVSADGNRLYAISDCGEGLTATLTYDAAGRWWRSAGAGDPLGNRVRGQLTGGSDAESLVLGTG